VLRAPESTQAPRPLSTPALWKKHAVCGNRNVRTVFRTGLLSTVRVDRVARLAQKDLRRVRAAARRLEQARAALRDAIHAANKSGETVRDIAPHAGLKPTRVQELLHEARRLEREQQE
jgi:hypothetical protein